MAGKTAKSIELGQHLVVGGLAIQIVFFGLFVVVAAVFHARINQQPTARMTSAEVPWRRHIHILYAASALILVRSIFRIIEYQQGNDGYLLGHEVFLYIFDAILMLIVMILLNAVHPGEISDLLSQRIVCGDDSELSSITNIGERPKAEEV